MAGTSIANFTTIGVTLVSAVQSPVTIASSGTIKVSGTDLSAVYAGYGVPGSVINAGLLSAIAGYGVRLLVQGSVTNGSAAGTTASITGGLYGVKLGAHGAGSVVNYGTISSTDLTAGRGIEARSSAAVVNGGNADTKALVSGYYAGIRIAGSGSNVTNFATVAATGTFGDAVYLRAGGQVINGSASDTVASLIAPEFGVLVQHAVGTVTNFGSIEGNGALGRGISLQGGYVVNGSNTDTAAYILSTSHSGVYSGGGPAALVSNFGTIKALGPEAFGSGIDIRPGGTVTNGSATDTRAAVLATGTGVYLEGAVMSSVVNFGTIESTAGGTGVNIYHGGDVTNGSTADTAALISGSTGVYNGGSGRIANFASISGLSGTAILMSSGGIILNGTTADTAARITGNTAVNDETGATGVLNFGLIDGVNGAALLLAGGGSVVNGGPTNTGAQIVATTTAVSGGSAALAVSNYGLINGSSNGIVFGGSGSVTNGSASDTAAMITSGGIGILGNGSPDTVNNLGTVTGGSSYGVLLKFGGLVVNGSSADTAASIVGGDRGVQIGLHGGGTVVNFGTIDNTSTILGSGIQMVDDGTIANGASNSTAAWVGGWYEGVIIGGARASVSNLGKITAFSSLGAATYLTDGGNVTNGSATDTVASMIAPDYGVRIQHAQGTLTNFGTIRGTGRFGHGVGLDDTGSVVNGSSADTAATISATDYNAVYIGGTGPSSVANYGEIEGLGPADLSNGVVINGGGSVTNGSVGDTKATIFGEQNGIYIQAASTSTVANFGTISSGAGAAVVLYLGGSVTNGGAADTVAQITGGTGAGSAGIYFAGPGTVTNFGTIAGGASAPAIVLRGGGVVTNGSAADTSAVVRATSKSGGSSAVYSGPGFATVTNFGTISAAAGSAIDLATGGTIVNGSSTDRTAAVLGGGLYPALFVTAGVATVTNFGTMTGGSLGGISFTNGSASAGGTVVNAGTIGGAPATAAVAISFGTGTERLVVDPGAVFIGAVVGGTGPNTLELASGASAGSIGGIGGTAFSNFGSVAVDTGATWTLTGTNETETFTNNGTATIAANGSVQVNTMIDPASSGVFALSAGSGFEIAADTGTADKIKFLGTAEAIIDKASMFGIHVGSTAYAGPLIQDFVSGDKIDLKDVLFGSISLNYNSTLGLLQVSSGSAVVASLLFDTTTLGAGSFHDAIDPAGRTVITHS